MSRAAPTVLVTSSYLPYPTNPTRWYALAVPSAYVDSVRLAGGVPLVTGPLDDARAVREALGCADAVLLVGGYDYDPATYGQPLHPKNHLLHPRRDRSDLLLARAAARSGVPLLGICGGMQAINIALGGTLHQHVPDVPALTGSDDHTMKVPDDNVHRVRVAPGSRLAALMGLTAVEGLPAVALAKAGGRWKVEGKSAKTASTFNPQPSTLSLEVNSSHHQAVDRLGKGLVAVAWSDAGLVEAFEGARRDRFLLGVQWHPERLAVAPPPDDIGAAPARGRPEQLAIFRALVGAAE
jgi:putative glutamine amidotransferase